MTIIICNTQSNKILQSKLTLHHVNKTTLSYVITIIFICIIIDLSLYTKTYILLLIRLTFNKHRILYYLNEYNPLLDSSNMSMVDWAKIASDINDNYQLFDSFIILHGTDTMAYTASALSFMLEDLGKTVILTGSQVSCSYQYIYTTHECHVE